MNKSLAILLIVLLSIFSGTVSSFVVLKMLTNGENGNIIIENKINENEVKNTKYTSLVDLQNEITDVVKEVSPSIVSIIIKKDLTIYRRDPFGYFQTPVGSYNRKIGGGTGFFITKDGKIITNKHVIEDEEATYTVITNDGDEYDAEIIAIDPLTDLAILQIDGDIFTPIEVLEENGNINIGEFVIAIGNAMSEYKNSVSFGIVSGKNRSIVSNQINLSGLIQTDAAINQGNSGGPLVNIDGKVIGINTAATSGANGLGFSIPLTQAKIDFIMKSIEKYGSIKRPFIGINYIANSKLVQNEFGLKYDYGAYIPDEYDAIVSGSNADKAGLEPGDLILEVDGNEINAENTLTFAIQNKIPGDMIKLKVYKKSGEIKEIDFVLGEGD